VCINWSIIIMRHLIKDWKYLLQWVNVHKNNESRSGKDLNWEQFFGHVYTFSTWYLCNNQLSILLILASQPRHGPHRKHCFHGSSVTVHYFLFHYSGFQPSYYSIQAILKSWAHSFYVYIKAKEYVQKQILPWVTRRFPVTIPWNLQNNPGISASAAQAWINCYDRNIFQHLATM
jgi:hypothetical protein